MRFIRSKKVGAAVAAGALVIAGAGMAFAYWSTSGTGTGSATTSAGASNLVIAQTSVISNMYPGDTAQTISGTVTNNAANSAYVATVTASIASVTGGAGACDATDYTLADPAMTVNQDVAAGAAVAFTGASIKFFNKATNQDGCKGATVHLAYASN
jgi:hypothetical protein